MGNMKKCSPLSRMLAFCSFLNISSAPPPVSFDGSFMSCYIGWERSLGLYSLIDPSPPASFKPPFTPLLTPSLSLSLSLSISLFLSHLLEHFRLVDQSFSPILTVFFFFFFKYYYSIKCKFKFASTQQIMLSTSPLNLP